MAPGEAEPRSVFQAVDLLVVVVGAVVAVSLVGLLWSVLRVGSVRPAYVREAQFLAGLAVLLVWTVRNRSGRGPGARDGSGRVGPPDGSAPRRIQLVRRLAGGRRATADDAAGTDAYLLATGVVLLALSLGVELVGGLPA